MIAQHLRRALERRAVFTLTAKRLIALDRDQRLAIDSIAGLAFTQLDMQFMGVDAATTKGVAGHRQFSHAVVVQVADAADIGIEADIQVEPGTGGLVLDLPARLEAVIALALIECCTEHHAVDVLIGFLVADLIVIAAQHEQAFALVVAVMHALHRRLHAQGLKLRSGNRRKYFETFLVAGTQQ
ncbi:hypothetical protein D3C79_828130 [compost metagenome]